MKRLKIVYVFVFIIILGLLILPQFNIKIGDSEIKYPNIDFSLVNSNATLGSFNKGYNLYDSEVYSATVSFDETLEAEAKESQLKELVKIINTRVAYSNLHDVKVFGSIDSEGYKINMQFPDYMQETEKLAKYLVGQGLVSFENDPQVSQVGVSLTDTEIEGQVKSQFDEQYGNVLSFKFAKTALTNFYYALQNENKYFLMRVDNSYFAVIQDPNYASTQSVDLQTAAIAVPFADLKLSPNVAMYTNIVRSYFLEKPIEQIITLNESPNIIKRDFVADKISYIALFIISGVAIITFLYFTKKNRIHALKFSLMVLSFMVTTTFILKLQSATLSVSLIMGFLIGLIIMFFTLGKLLSIDEPLQRSYLKEIVNYSLFVALCAYVLFRFLSYSNYMVDGLGALLAAMLSLMFLATFNYKYILDSELKNFRK